MSAIAKPSQALPRANWKDVLVVVLLALVVRAIYLYETADVVFVRHFVGDAASYFSWAQRIAGGDWIGSKPFYQAPAYPYFLGLLFKLFGAGTLCVRAAQCFSTAIAAGLLTILGSWIFDRRVGFVAGVMLALYAPSLFFDGIVQKASLGCALTCAVMWLVARVSRKAGAWWLVLLGVVSALLCLTRENAFVWLGVIVAWLLLSRRVGGQIKQPRRGLVVRWMVLAAYAFGVAVVFAPVLWRNAAVCGEWSTSTFQAGPNFYIGNHAGATGRYVPLVRGHETPAFERSDATELAERAVGEKLSPRGVSRFWFGRAFADIRAHPWDWVRLLGRKGMMVVNDYEVADAESAIVYADASFVLRVLQSVFRFGVLCPLAALGIVLTWRRWRELWVFYALTFSMVCAIALFYVMARYRYPLVPLLILFAAAGVVETFRGIGARGWSWRAWPCYGTMVVVFVAVVCWWPIHDRRRLDAMAWMNAGVAHAQLGELESATRFFRLAVSRHPGSAEAQNNLAQALAMRGAFQEAVEHYRAALSLEPGLIGANYNLGVALEQLGRRDEALGQYRKAVEVDPADVAARAGIERIQKANRMDEH